MKDSEYENDGRRSVNDEISNEELKWDYPNAYSCQNNLLSNKGRQEKKGAS